MAHQNDHTVEFGLSGCFFRSRLVPGSTLALCLVAVTLHSSPVHAQANPGQINPGAIQNDIDRQRRQFEQQSAPPKLQGPAVVGPQREKPGLLKPGGPKFRLKNVTFDSSKFLTPDDLKGLASKYVGKDADISTLQQLIADINALYAEKGIVTGIATLPEQDAANGIVHIKLTEGRLEKMAVQGNVQTSADYILKRVGEPTGEVLDVPKVNRDVVWFNRTNDVQIKALLQPGTSFGLTDLNYAVTEPPRNTLQLFYDNQGVNTTGEDEAGVFYKLHGLFGVDDRLTFYGVGSEGNLNGNIAYNIPFNDWGGRIGASYTQGKIKIVAGTEQSLDVTGKSNQAAVNISQPLVATENWLVLANGAAAHGATLSDFASVPNVDDNYDKETGGAAITYSNSSLAINLSPAFNSVQWHDNILGGNRFFETFSGSGSLQFSFDKNYSMSVLGSWQYTSVDLLPGDQLFVVGGPSTVRGYPTNAATGDSGYYTNFEFHRNWSDLVQGLDTYVFFDSGAVFSTFPDRVDLKSTGFGASWTPISALTFEASYGAPWNAIMPLQPHFQAYGRVTFRPLLLLASDDKASVGH